MKRGDEKRLDDIRHMCATAATIVHRGRDVVQQDEVFWLALERTVEIAGEAAGHVSNEARARFPTVAWNELAGARVILAHAYHRVDADLLWGIAVDDLPAIAEALGATRADAGE